MLEVNRTLVSKEVRTFIQYCQKRFKQSSLQYSANVNLTIFHAKNAINSAESENGIVSYCQTDKEEVSPQRL